MRNPSLPASLKIVTWVFIILGIGSIVETIFNFWHGRFITNLGFLGIFIGRGLLRLRSGWQTLALIWTWLGLVLTPMFWLFIFRTGATPIPQILGVTVGTSRGAFFLCSGIQFVLLAWQAWVLGKADIRRLFTQQDVAPESPADDAFSDAKDC